MFANVWNIVKFSLSHYTWNIYSVRFLSIYNSKRHVPLFNANKLCILSTGFSLVRTFNIPKNILCTKRRTNTLRNLIHFKVHRNWRYNRLYFERIWESMLFSWVGCFKWQFRNTYILLFIYWNYHCKSFINNRIIFD